jgi:replicative DNA helicase
LREAKRLAIPASPEAEAALLSGMILHPDSIARLVTLDAEAFHDPLNAEVYLAIQRLYTKGQPIDVVSVNLEMRASGSDASIEEVHDLISYAPGPASMRMFAGTVADCHRLRQLMHAGQQIGELAMTPGYNSAEQIDKAQMLLAKLATVRARRDPQFILDTLPGYLDHLQQMSEGNNPAIPTGIGRLDQLLNGGMRRGEQLVIGARPKHGKTALSLAIARNVAHTYSVLFLSQEMPVRQLMHRHSELEIVAHRNGPQGVVPLEFIGKYQQMGDWTRDIPIRHAATPSAPMPPLRNRGAKF